MLKMFCDVCSEEYSGEDFFFEASILETFVDLTDQLPAPTKRQQKRVVHVCKNCYDKDFKKVLDKSDGKEK